MTVARQRRRRRRRQGRRLRLHRQHLGVGGRVRLPRRAAADRAAAGRPDRHRQARPGDRARRQGRAGRRQLRRLPRAGPHAGRRLPGRPGQLGQPDPDRGAEDGGVRDRRRPRRRAGPARPAGRQRREYHGLLAWLHPVRGGRSRRLARPRDVGLPGRRRRPAGAGPPGARIPRPSPPRSGSATRPRRTSAMAAKDESGGLFEAVTDEQILAAQAFLAAREGVFVEPASAAGVAGLLAKHAARRGRVRAADRRSR